MVSHGAVNFKFSKFILFCVIEAIIVKAFIQIKCICMCVYARAHTSVYCCVANACIIA